MLAAITGPGSPARGPEALLIEQLKVTYLQSLRHFKLKFFGLHQEMATTWPYNWSPELILGAFCTMFQA